MQKIPRGKIDTMLLHFKRWFMKKEFWVQAAVAAVILFFVVSGGIILWVATLRIPDLNSFENKIISGSTKLYDRTGEVLLYDVNKDVKQEVVAFDQISPYVKNATIAIEDDEFYKHSGVRPLAFLRAVLVNLTSGEFKQGGSTITQQVIKNALLTSDKKISRKIKEWVLALKLEHVMPKDDILNLYLNGTSYGGIYYGVGEASKNFFGKEPKDLTIAEAAYIAAIPKAPSYYSPYGNHKDKLEERKNLVLSRMKTNGYITEEQYTTAKAEKVEFKPLQNRSIKAPHFVMYIVDYLTQKYGEEMVKNGNLKVITSLDYKMQEKGEAIVKDYALKNEKNFNAENAGLVAIDPATGQILTMVGSRDYFDENIEGNYNITLAHRQPGSAFKPFAYVTAFNKGYTPDTVLFDLPTEFSTACDISGDPLSPGAVCYKPENYDHNYRGPMSLRNALAQSINIPAVKVLYLAGMKDTLQTARDLGITSLTDINRYGLTLVLGGGEVSPLEMTSAYSVFASNGVKNPHTGIIKVTDRDGAIVEEFKPNPTQVLPEQSVLQLNSVLSDNAARLPLNGPGSATDFPGREVALKTGTTNDSRDAWIIGYTPQITVGAWAGNNNNKPMVKKTSGLIIAPLWRAFMNEILEEQPEVSFKRPDPIDPTLKPILRGFWQGGQTYVIDSSTGLPATDATPPEFRQEQVSNSNVHSILYWVDKSNPKGPAPSNPASDLQFYHWEAPVRAWAERNSTVGIPPQDPYNNPTQPPTGDTTQNRISFITPAPNAEFASNDTVSVVMAHQGAITRVEFFLNSTPIGTSVTSPFSTSFVPNNVQGHQITNTLRAVAYDGTTYRGEVVTSVTIRQ